MLRLVLRCAALAATLDVEQVKEAGRGPSKHVVLIEAGPRIEAGSGFAGYYSVVSILF